MSTKPSAASVSTQSPLVDTCRSLFGAHPDDVIQPMEWGIDALTEVSAILAVITQESAESYISVLARAAKKLADDMANTMDCRREDFASHLRRAMSEVPA